MARTDSAEIVNAFWHAVWQSRNPEAVDDFVAEDFVISNGGEPLRGRENFKAWVAAFLDKVRDLEFEIVETFQNHDGSRVASRFVVSGKNNGVLGAEPCQSPISFTGTAVWELDENGKLLHNHVERASWELFNRLNARVA
jgi:steroid delta-isomerase-like uncharacterized protein